MHRRWVTATATAAGTSRLTLGRLGTWLRGCAGGGGGLGCQCGCAGGRRWSLVAGILRRTLFHHRFPYGFQGGLKLRGRLCDSFARGVGWWTRWATVGLRRLGNALGATLYAVLVVSAWCDTCTCSPGDASCRLQLLLELLLSCCWSSRPWLWRLQFRFLQFPLQPSLQK